MADVRQQVVLSLMTEFENFSVFKPGDYNLPALKHHAGPGRCLEHGARTATRRCRRRSLGTRACRWGSRRPLEEPSTDTPQPARPPVEIEPKRCLSKGVR